MFGGTRRKSLSQVQNTAKSYQKTHYEGQVDPDVVLRACGQFLNPIFKVAQNHVFDINHKRNKIQFK
jgi:hypothetical protein